MNYVCARGNLPFPPDSVSLMKALKIGRVKLYDYDPEVLTELADSSLSIIIVVKNEEIPTVASSI